jgi:transcriptional regulator with XRE-family HTH domain
MDRAQLAEFLRARRQALQPEDVGLPRGTRRRTGGLRREEVAALCSMSVDYYSRIEQQRGPHPSEQILAAIARGLHLSLDERDHLFRLAGHPTPQRVFRSDHLNPGMLRIFDRLQDTPAQVMSHLGETLKQTRLAVALMGDDSVYTGMARSLHYRWFTDPAYRMIYPEEDHPMHDRLMASHLRGAYTRDGQGSRAAAIVEALLVASPTFATIWPEHPVLGPYCAPKRVQHPELGILELHCQTLVDPDQSQTLMVFTAVPGSESHEKLQLLSMFSGQRI